MLEPYDTEFDVLYKVTIMKTFFVSAQLEADERLIIERAVELFNSDETYHSIVPTDVVLVQYYDAEH